ncbi:hypothetical protein KC722_01370 [Candidatus Kaiserbacteria bacterium]|nr:hypothetical protein [Candidatus Kaiserbacteria bacterium]MCB9811912.1 hypothetical protein [Candidatus Nomurabacteria bacterium]
MFVISHQSDAMYRAVATLVTFALLLWVLGLHSQAEAANLTNVKDRLSDSDIGAVSNHSIEFVVPTGSTGIDATTEQIVVSFPTGFNMGSVAFGDVDLAVNGVDQTLAAAAAGATWGATVSGQDLILEADTATVGANATVTIAIGTNATGGTNQITNPSSATSSEITITMPDDVGKTRVVILDNVLVTAAVDTVFQFTVAGIATAGWGINGTSTTIGTSSATAIPFGTLTANEIETIGQQLNVLSNAIGGFVVTVEQDSDLQSATGAVIDGFADGAYTNTPSDWAAPSNNVAQSNTWGHWGLTSSDDHDDGNGTFQSCGGALTGGCWVAASTTPREIFSHNGPADNTTANVGSTTVAYQVEITGLQEAADDYNTTLTYIATPTF